jgi:peptidoglycan-N-acetylglucosamine deacetylase
VEIKPAYYACPVIALTFDDGPDPVWTPRVLSALASAEAHGTFFVIAPRAARYPHLVEQIQAAGHAVEYHCVRHLRHTDCTEDEVEADTREGLECLRALGATPTRWRTPWGISASFTERVARRHRLGLTRWAADSHDWAGGDAESMLAYIAPELEQGGEVLMHDGIGPGARREGCSETVRLVDAISRHATERGLTLL